MAYTDRDISGFLFRGIGSAIDQDIPLPDAPDFCSEFLAEQGVIYVSGGRRCTYRTRDGSAISSIGVYGSYLGYAVRSARSIKKVSPNLPIAIFTDEDPGEDCFDFVFPLATYTTKKWLLKIDSIIQSPFRKTLVLDVDTKVYSNKIHDIFALLSLCDVCGYQITRGSQRIDQQFKRYGVPKCFPELNDGVIGIHFNEKTRQLLRLWRQIYIEQPWNHEAAFRDALYRLPQVRLAGLHERYNDRDILVQSSHILKKTVIHHQRKGYADLMLYVAPNKLKKIERIHPNKKISLLSLKYDGADIISRCLSDSGFCVSVSPQADFVLSDQDTHTTLCIRHPIERLYETYLREHGAESFSDWLENGNPPDNPFLSLLSTIAKRDMTLLLDEEKVDFSCELLLQFDHVFFYHNLYNDIRAFLKAHGITPHISHRLTPSSSNMDTLHDKVYLDFYQLILSKTYLDIQIFDYACMHLSSSSILGDQ